MQKLSEADFKQSIACRFEKIVSEMPHHTALESGPVEWSYSELNARANRLAHVLLDRIGDQPEPVILLLEGPIHNVTGQLGALKARKACIPMDVNFPLARQSEIFNDSGSRLILAEDQHLDRAIAIASADRVLRVEEAEANDSTENPGLVIDPATLAYILYTSGSTGRPKGVMQSHASLLHNSMTYSEALRIGSTTRVTTPTSFVYTSTLWALLASLTNGATFVTTSFGSPGLFLDSLKQARIHAIHLLVTLLRQFMHSLTSPARLPDLRVVFTGGEALRKEDVARFAERFPADCELGYNYGSTEAGLVCYKRLRSNLFQHHSLDPAFPIGPVVEDTTVEFFDEDGHAASEGQIAVRSNYIADGYWKQPELTNKHFPAQYTDPKGRVYLTGDLGRLSANGDLICLGRNDSQVKIRGYRVNLNEIENALCSIPGIVAAAVCTMDRGQQKMDLIAYIHSDPSFTASLGELRHTLALILPLYMIPASFVHVERIPMTGSGKLDRRALPDPGLSRPDLNVPFESAKTDTEKALCIFFSEAMSLESIGIRDNLMDLGADSITIFRVIGNIQALFNIHIPPSVFFDTPFIEVLAQTIDEQKNRNGI